MTMPDPVLRTTPESNLIRTPIEMAVTMPDSVPRNTCARPGSSQVWTPSSVRTWAEEVLCLHGGRGPNMASTFRRN